MKLLWCALVGACLAPAAAQATATWYVDVSNPACHDDATGELVDPYCSITAALDAHHDPGTTILVLPGVYRERVLVPDSGEEGAPLVLQASDGAIVDGADDFSDPDLWQQASGAVWLAPLVTWSPSQVFVDSVRLAPWAGDSQDLPSGSFTYVSGAGLYVNIGGENPGLHLVEVGRRTYGFQLSHRSWVSIRGFRIEHSELKGVYMTQRSEHNEVVGNIIRKPFRYGIQVDTSSCVLIRDNVVTNAADHGIVFTRGTTGSRIERNESAYNAKPNVRQANGVYLFRSPANVISDNRCHHNQDSGVQIQSGSNGVLCLQNRSWSNGDHGFDNLKATGNEFIGNVAYGNYKDGFSFEGNSSDNSLYNSIAVENGLQTNEADLWVEDASRVGFRSDYNVFWNSTAQPPLKMGSLWFASVADYSAQLGLDPHSFQSNPRFVAPASGNFELSPGSSAIDAADSGVPNWPTLDATGRERRNDTHVKDTGSGPIAFADRGALECSAPWPQPGGIASRPPVIDDPMPGESTPGDSQMEPVPPPAPSASGPSQPEGRSAPVASGTLTSKLEVRPNPARVEANILFRLSRRGSVRLLVCDAGGRLVRELLAAGDVEPGEHRVAWDLTDRSGAPLRAGMYYCVLRAPEGAHSERLALVR